MLQAENSRYQALLELEDKKFVRDVIGDVANYDWLWTSDYWSEISSEPDRPNTDSPETVNGTRERRKYYCSQDNPALGNVLTFDLLSFHLYLDVEVKRPDVNVTSPQGYPDLCYP